MCDAQLARPTLVHRLEVFGLGKKMEFDLFFRPAPVEFHGKS
jgi:hypothetical protein